jgi:hypothetical protein
MAVMPPIDGKPEPKPSKLKIVAIARGVLMVIVLAFMFTISTSEAIPDHARFLVNTTEGYIVPEPLPNHSIFYPLPNSDDRPYPNFNGTVSWGELCKKEHPYHDLGLPRTRQWDNFVFYGQEVSLLRSLFFPPESRWDKEGRWRY